MNLSNENIIHQKRNGIEYLQFKKLLEYKKDITHAYVIGLDKNFRTSRGENNPIDEEEYNIAVNSYKTLCRELGLDYGNIVKTNQTHTKNVKQVNEKSNGIEPDFSKYKDTDGLITNQESLILATTNADCILLLFYDPVKKVIANVHSGWKGTLQRISVETIHKMKEQYKCNPQDIICCICPSIRKCHFEVDEDVYKMFKEQFQDLNDLDNKIIERKGNKWHIDTVLINQEILKKEGLKSENIIDSGICSVCNKQIIHSYRAEGANYGLSTAIITIH